MDFRKQNLYTKVEEIKRKFHVTRVSDVFFSTYQVYFKIRNNMPQLREKNGKDSLF